MWSLGSPNSLWAHNVENEKNKNLKEMALFSFGRYCMPARASRTVSLFRKAFDVLCVVATNFRTVRKQFVH